MKDNILLKVEELSVSFPKHKKLTTVVNKISFELREGEILGIVGESGSGKSMTALSVMGLLPSSAKITNGSIYFMGEDLLRLNGNQLRRLKGTGISMVFQEPMTSFNPLHKIGEQVEEMLRLHTKLNKEEYKAKTLAALEEAGLNNPTDVYDKYPHQLSGGMRQRAMIAMAMIAGPKLIIADEPTTALDVTIQKKILNLLKKVNEAHGTSIILISHDLSVIKSICSRALVMKDGEIVESGAADELFTNPRIEYTRELVASVPTVDLNDKELEIAEDTAVSKDVILNIQNLNVYYKEQKKGVLTSKNRKQVVKDITISVREGESLGIVGESGCGKSSLAKAIVGLNDEIEGTIQITDINGENKVSRVKPQMVFQDPYASLNPTKKVGWILEEPLKMQNKYKKAERKEKVLSILEQVGLAEKYLERYPYQLSGGQRQRVAIAAALILNPKLIVLDEPVSSLDVTVQAQIISLLKELQQKYHLTYLFISHDLKVIYQICNRVSVMYQGEVVETNTTREVFFHPIHDYTKELLGSALI